MAPLYPCCCMLQLDGLEQGADVPPTTASEAFSVWWQLCVTWFDCHLVRPLAWEFGPAPLHPDISRLQQDSRALTFLMLFLVAVIVSGKKRSI